MLFNPFNRAVVPPPHFVGVVEKNLLALVVERNDGMTGTFAWPIHNTYHATTILIHRILNELQICLPDWIESVVNVTALQFFVHVFKGGTALGLEQPLVVHQPVKLLQSQMPCQCFKRCPSTITVVIFYPVFLGYLSIRKRNQKQQTGKDKQALLHVFSTEKGKVTVSSSLFVGTIDAVQEHFPLASLDSMRL